LINEKRGASVADIQPEAQEKLLLRRKEFFVMSL